MKKRLLILLPLVAFASLTASGADIDSETARKRGQAFMERTGAWYATGRDIGLRRGALTLAYTAAGNEGTGFYVFNREGGGFVLVSAYDGAEEILGYSQHGTFDYSQAPDEMKFWLDSYVRQIDCARAAGSQMETRSDAHDGWHDIEPLIETHWNQDAPYNMFCPEIDGERTMVGCGAVAAAQILNYNRWPAKGRGTVTYYSGSILISNDLSSHSYVWSNMPAKCYSNDDARNVAQLLYDCSTAMETEYGLRKDGGSGSYSTLYPHTFVSYFDYDSTALFLMRPMFDDSEWNAMIYNELACGRPVLYCGQTDKYGGHAFVCDGYSSSKDMFHMNFGWGGNWDAYIKLEAIRTSGVFDFSDDQEAVVNIMRNTDAEPVPNLILLEKGNITCTNIFKYGQYTTFLWDCGTYIEDSQEYDNMVTSVSCVPVSVQLGLKITDTGTGRAVYVVSDDDSNIYDLSVEMGLPYFYVIGVIMPELPNGVYHVEPVYRLERYRHSEPDSHWYEIGVFKGCTKYYEMVIGTPAGVSVTRSDDGCGNLYWTVDGRAGIGPGRGVMIYNGKKYRHEGM